MTNKRISPFTLGSLAGLNLLLYGFFISKYIQNETISVVIVTSLYLLIFTLFVLTDLFIKNMTKQKTKLLLSLMIFCIQFGLGVFFDNGMVSTKKCLCPEPPDVAYSFAYSCLATLFRRNFHSAQK